MFRQSHDVLLVVGVFSHQLSQQISLRLREFMINFCVSIDFNCDIGSKLVVKS